MDEPLKFDPNTKAVTLSAARHSVCLEAAHELDALCRVLPGLVYVEGDHEPHLVVRGIAGRMLRLSNALMAGLYDPVVSVDELQRRVLLEGGGG